MNEIPEQPKEANGEVSPTSVARRTMLKHGAKLGYVIPLALSAIYATPAYAQAPSGGESSPPPPPPPRPGPLIRKIQPDAVPAELFALIHAVEGRSVATPARFRIG